MSDDDEQLRLNRLRQFRKSSAHVALEVHSHCEVPAGCGGVVMRWRSATAPVGVRFSLWTRGKRELALVDGVPLPEQRVTLAPGRHVLALVLAADASSSFGDTALLLASAALDPAIATALSSTSSAASGNARATASAPPASWAEPAFAARHDQGFVDLVDAVMPKTDDWLATHLKERAPSLGVPAALSSCTRLWIRFAFEVGAGGFA
ncbi:MAG TPA: hypothetical protein VGO62_21945 [Myxococcota bacterium]